MPWMVPRQALRWPSRASASSHKQLSSIDGVPTIFRCRSASRVRRHFTAGCGGAYDHSSPLREGWTSGGFPSRTPRPQRHAAKMLACARRWTTWLGTVRLSSVYTGLSRRHHSQRRSLSAHVEAEEFLLAGLQQDVPVLDVGGSNFALDVVDARVVQADTAALDQAFGVAVRGGEVRTH